MNLTIGIVGVKNVGLSVAILAAQSGANVMMYDEHPSRLQQALLRIDKSLENRLSLGAIDQEKAKAIKDKITPLSTIKSLTVCDIIIEATEENLGRKKRIFKELDEVTDDHVILASSTQSASITVLSSQCFFKSRVIGSHVVNATSSNAVVEIVKGVDTTTEVIDKATFIFRSFFKNVLVTRESPGFVVNRILSSFFTEAIAVNEEGTASFQEIDAMMRSVGGFHQGPFEMMDFIGIDLCYTSILELYNSFFQEERFRPSFLLKSRFEAGYYGLKTGKGFYEYKNNNDAPRMTIRQSEVESSRHYFDENHSGFFMVKQSIYARIISVVINEALFCVQENVASEGDIDMAMKLGMRFPSGPILWGREIGFDIIKKILNTLFNEFHDARYKTSPLLNIYQ